MGRTTPPCSAVHSSNSEADAPIGLIPGEATASALFNFVLLSGIWLFHRRSRTVLRTALRRAEAVGGSRVSRPVLAGLVASPGWQCPFGGVAAVHAAAGAAREEPGVRDGSRSAGGRLAQGRPAENSIERRPPGQPLGGAVNGSALTETVERSEPYPDPYPGLAGRPFEMRAWTIPVSLVQPGSNRLEFELLEGNASSRTNPGTRSCLAIWPCPCRKNWSRGHRREK